jgi:glutaredoxin
MNMSKKRKIEVFSAGCPLCIEAIATVRRNSCPACEVTVINMQDTKGAARARELGVRSVPAVAINGKLADCCTGRGIDMVTLKASGLGQPES